jgi:hypothetical protein
MNWSAHASAQERRANHTALRDLLVLFDVEVRQDQLDSAMKKTDALLDKFRRGMGVVRAFGAALAGHALTQFVTQTIDAADNVGDFAARLGITTDEFQILKAVADDVGTSVESLQTGFRTLGVQMKQHEGDFAKLGVETRNADGSLRAVTDVFWDAGTAIGAINDQSTRFQTAQKMLGRGAMSLLPIFAGGAEAVAKYREQIAETAIVFDAAFIEKSDAASKQIQAFQNRLARVKALIVAELLPAFQWALGVFSRLAGTAQKFVESGRGLQTVLAAGAVAFLRWIPSVVLWRSRSLVGWLFKIKDGLKLLGRMLKGFVGFLIIDELITLFRGGDTLIGRFIDKLFGVGAAAKGVERVKKAATDLWDTFMLVLDVLFDIRNDGDMTADQLEESFMRATENIGKLFDALGDRIKKAIGRWMGITPDSVREARIGAGINPDTGARESGQALEEPNWFVKKFAELSGFQDEVFAARLKHGIDPMTGAALAPPPALAPAAVQRIAGGATTIQDNRHQEVHITAGNATPAVAREIAQRTRSAFDPAAQDFGAAAASVGLL